MRELRRRPCLRWAAAAVMLGLGLALPRGPAAAHAILIQSTPAANATVAGPKIGFSLRYNSRIDKGRSKLVLTWPDKSQKDLPIIPGGPEDILAAAAELPPGSYSLRWQVLAIDGHITRGDVPFQVEAD